MRGYRCRTRRLGRVRLPRLVVLHLLGVVRHFGVNATGWFVPACGRHRGEVGRDGSTRACLVPSETQGESLCARCAVRGRQLGRRGP